MRYHCIVWLAIFLCLTATSTLPARIWTNRIGQEIDADFVDATEEEITLRKRDDSIVKFRLELLCDADQEFVYKIQLRRRAKGGESNIPLAKPSELKEILKNTPGQKSGARTSVLPPASKFSADTNANKLLESPPVSALDSNSNQGATNSNPPKTNSNVANTKNSTHKPVKISDRAWTDVEGNKIIARFIALQGSTVTLHVKGKPVQIPYEKFSLIDRQYMREVLESMGEKFEPVINGFPLAQSASIPVSPAPPNFTPGSMLPSTANPALNTLPTGNSVAPADNPPTPSLLNYEGIVLDDGTTVTRADLAAIPPAQQGLLLSMSQNSLAARQRLLNDTMRSLKLENKQQQVAEIERQRLQKQAEHERLLAEVERRRLAEEQQQNAARLTHEEQHLFQSQPFTNSIASVESNVNSPTTVSQSSPKSSPAAFSATNDTSSNLQCTQCNRNNWRIFNGKMRCVYCGIVAPQADDDSEGLLADAMSSMSAAEKNIISRKLSRLGFRGVITLILFAISGFIALIRRNTNFGS